MEGTGGAAGAFYRPFLSPSPSLEAFTPTQNKGQKPRNERSRWGGEDRAPSRREKTLQMVLDRVERDSGVIAARPAEPRHRFHG